METIGTFLLGAATATAIFASLVVKGLLAHDATSDKTLTRAIKLAEQAWAKASAPYRLVCTKCGQDTLTGCALPFIGHNSQN